MGSHHSAPRERRPKTRLVDRRNRLTKPRTNSNSSAVSAPLPAFTPKFNSPRSSKAVRKSASQRIVHRNSLIIKGNDIECLKRRSNSLSLPQSSTQTCDTFSWAGDVTRGSIEVASPTQLRRRSTLLAAPPATITRKPISEEEEPKIIQDEPAELAALDLAVNTDKSRSTTPSGYSVLGTFKRGSLRITNASPTPTVGTLTPLPTPGGILPNTAVGIAHSKELDTHGSVAVAITTRANHRNSIRIIPPTTSYPDPASTSPFSFQETPVIDTFAWDIRHANAQLSGLQDSHPFPKQDPKQTPQPVRCTSPKSIFDEIAKRQRAYSASHINTTTPPPQKLRRPSVIPAPDSGYSSTSSNKSWQPPPPEAVASALTSSRAGAYAALEGGKMEAQIIRVKSSPALRRTMEYDVPEMPRRLCKSPVPEKITGQTYYQRFTRRRSQVMTVESRYWF